MSLPVIGQAAPRFELPATGAKTLGSGDFAGKNLVLYFYPKDSTPGCTLEGQAFRDLHDEFAKAGAVILGVSRDSLKAHENFRAKQCFPFDLLSDSEETLCTAYDVIKMKTMYGKQVRGIERSTFLIDAKGILRAEWRKLSVKGHAEEVLAAVRNL